MAVVTCLAFGWFPSNNLLLLFFLGDEQIGYFSGNGTTNAAETETRESAEVWGQANDGEGGLHPGFTCLEAEVPCWAFLNIAPPIWFPWDWRQFQFQSLETESGSISREAASGLAWRANKIAPSKLSHCWLMGDRTSFLKTWGKMTFLLIPNVYQEPIGICFPQVLFIHWINPHN